MNCDNNLDQETPENIPKGREETYHAAAVSIGAPERDRSQSTSDYSSSTAGIHARGSVVLSLMA
jgi:hypothetical protein